MPTVRMHHRLMLVGMFALANLAVLIGPAGAHHPQVEGQADCAGKVTVLATSWKATSDAGINNELWLYFREGGSASPVDAEATWTLVTDDGGGALAFSFTDNADPALDRRFEHVLWVNPAWESVDVLVVAQRNWGRNETLAPPRKFGDDDFHVDQHDLDIAVGRGCDGHQVASVVVDCDSGGTATLDNSSGAVDVTYVVTNNGDLVGEVPVLAGSSASLPIPLVEDGAYDVVVRVGTFTLAEAAGIFACEDGGASLRNDCSEGGVTAILDNTNSQAPVDFLVVVGEVEQVVTVPGGESDEFFVAVTEGDDFLVEVYVGEELLAAIEGTQDCLDPAADVVESCQLGGLLVSLDNTNSEVAGQFDVLVNGETVPTDPVPAGDTGELFVPIDEDGDYTAIVSLNGEELAALAGTLDCGDVTGSDLTVDCAAGGVTFFLDNSNSQVETGFVMHVNDETVENPLPAGDAGGPIFFPLPEDADYEVSLVADGAVIAAATGTFDCVGVAASVVEISCEEGAVAFLDNAQGVEDATFTLTNNGDATDHVVPAGETKEVTLALAEDEAYDITIHLDGEQTFRVTDVFDCEMVPTGASTSAGLLSAVGLLGLGVALLREGRRRLTPPISA